MAVNELNIETGRLEKDWVINATIADASTGVVLKSAVPDYRYGIKSLVISTVEDEKNISILDGDSVLIGPVQLGKYNPLTINFLSPVYNTKGNSLTVKTDVEFDFFLIIQGTTGFPVPSKPFNPNPSDGATGSVSVLGWESDNQSITFSVYLGTNSNSLELVSTQTETSYSPTSLNENTQYYWRVDESLNGNYAKGDVWSFTTA